MTKLLIDSNLFKSKTLVLLESVLLAACLCVLALRTTFAEAPIVQSITLSGSLCDPVYSLSVSAVLMFAFVLWFIWSFWSNRFLYRVTGIEIGLCIFCVAAVVSSFAASDKRLAVTAVVVLLAPVFCAILLVQILDSQSKIKIVLVVIAALGMLSAYQCSEQFFSSNQMTIEQYEEAPETILEPLGIKPDTFQHFLLEHRLYSRGARAFFTTRNSAGSFALIAFFAAIALFIAKFKDRKSGLYKPLDLFGSSAVAAIVIFGLAITRSKGAIIGLLFAIVMFIVYLLFGDRLKSYRKAILIFFIIAVIVGGCFVVSYGLANGRLPGGNSMLVRWQYWHTSARIYADHLFTGVGPGNFAHFYPHYKSAEALESVADPHNFPLSILAQYGPLGLAGFLAMIFIPLWKVTSFNAVGSPLKIKQHREPFRILALAFLMVILATLLLIRPMLMSVAPTETFEESVYVIFTLYLTPVLVFIVGFFLLTMPLNAVHDAQSRLCDANITIAALFCAALGVILHNLIDFAIFEPGVFVAFWIIIACMIAADCRRNARAQFAMKAPFFSKALITAAGLVLFAAYFYYAWWPVYKSTGKMQQAYDAICAGQFIQAHSLLSAAAEDDRLSPTASNMNGRLYLQHYNETGQQQPDLLEKAEECFRDAIKRDWADYKNYEKLSEVYLLLGQTQKAYDWSLKATNLYPGCGRLWFGLAKIAEQLGRNDLAVEQYQKTIDIEDSYRRQFQIMYPEREKVVSRIDEEKYRFAMKRIKELSEKSGI